MRLEAFITDLLYDHDCVIVPGFGGLVASYRPARLNRVTHVIKPPSKHVGFNRNLTHNDGLLAAYAARLMGVSYKEAMERIEETVAEFQHQLNIGNRVVWEKIGLFFRDRSGGLQFIPEEQENFLLESFGLTAVQLRPIEYVVSTPPEEEVVILPAVERKPVGLSWWKVAAVLAIPLAGAGIWFAGGFGSHHPNINLAGLNPFKPTEKTSSYQVRTSGVQFSAWDQSDETEWQSLMDKNGVRVNIVSGEEDALGIEIRRAETGKKRISSPKSRSGSESGHSYLLIGGAFEMEENADLFVQQLKSDGFPAFRAGKRGRLHLVAFSGFAKEADARTALQEVRSSGRYSVWMHRAK